MGTVSVSLPSDGQTIDAADYNVPINTIVAEINGGLDSDNIEAGGVVPSSLTAGTGTSWAWQAWTPTWASLTIGNATVVGKYLQIGKTVTAVLSVVFGNTTSITGTAPTFTLPVAAAGVGTYPAAMATGVAATATFSIGVGQILDSGTAAYNCGVVLVSSTTGKINIFGAGATYVGGADVTASAPMVWTTSDNFAITFTYETA